MQAWRPALQGQPVARAFCSTCRRISGRVLQTFRVLRGKSLQAEGELCIQRRDGRVFVVRPERRKGSPLDVKGLDLGMTAEEVLEYIRDGRERL